MGVLQEIKRSKLPLLDPESQMLLRVRSDYFVPVPYDEPRWDYL